MSAGEDVIRSYQGLMDAINNGLIVLDAQSNIYIGNKWFNRHCEYAMEEKYGYCVYDLFPELKNSRINDAIDNTFEFGYPTFLSNIFTPTPFPLYQPKNFDEDHFSDKRIQQQIIVSRLEQAGKYYCLIQINDVTAAIAREHTLEQEITERKFIEDALLESEIKHLTIMEKMIDGLVVFNKAGFIESFNPACETLFGYSESGIIGRSVSTLFEGLNGPETNAETSDIDSDFAVDENFIGAYREIIAIKNNREKFDVELSISNMKIGEKVFYTAIIRDITERKQIDKLKTEFISTVSHELRTPLTSIRGSLGLICGGAVDPATDKAYELIKIAHNNCDRLVFLINDILDMEKIAANGLQYDIGRHNLRSLINRCIDENQSYADEYKVCYRLAADDKNFEADIDSHRFMQVIANLLSNAAKFSNANDVVDIRLLEKDGEYLIQVQDYGEGIPDTFKETIWSKFTQADASTTRRKGGTGLGLTISRALVLAMGGKIWFESTLGEGTTFIISLPASENKVVNA